MKALPRDRNAVDRKSTTHTRPHDLQAKLLKKQIRGGAAAPSAPPGRRAGSTPGAASVCCTRHCRPNTGDKLRSGARVHTSRRGHEAALYESHASLPCNGAAESFVSFIPLFDGLEFRPR